MILEDTSEWYERIGSINLPPDACDEHGEPIDGMQTGKEQIYRTI